MTNEEIIRESMALCQSEVLNAVFVRLRTRILDEWEGAVEAEFREECWRRLQTLKIMEFEIMEPIKQVAMMESSDGICRMFLREEKAKKSRMQ